VEHLAASGNFRRLSSLPLSGILTPNPDKPKRESWIDCVSELSRRDIPVVACGLVKEKGEMLRISISSSRKKHRDPIRKLQRSIAYYDHQSM
jgi:hypothetical protein